MIIQFDSDDFLPNVMAETPGCANPIAANAVRRAAIEFCVRSNFWKVDIDPIDVIANESTYDLDAPTGDSRVSKVLYVAIDGTEIFPKTTEELDRTVKLWRTDSGTPEFYFLPNPASITLAKIPDASYILTATVALCPKQNATGIEQFVFEAHMETIADGAKARLMAMPSVEWSNPQLALHYEAQFNAGVAAAGVDSAKGFSRAPIRTVLHGR